MFTSEQIEEIHRNLQLLGVKDMDLPTLTEQLDGSEVLTLIKNGRNIQLKVNQLLNFDMFTPEQLESLRGPQGLDGKNAYQTWLAQGNVGTYDDYLTILQLPALTASESLTTTVKNKLDEADDVIIRLNNKNAEMQQVISEATIAKDLAQEVVTHPPAIINGYWHLWNHVTKQYDTTYVKATGDFTNISNGAKTNADAGVFGQISITDDYMYICVMSGSAGSAIWKKTVLFQV